MQRYLQLQLWKEWWYYTQPSLTMYTNVQEVVISGAESLCNAVWPDLPHKKTDRVTAQVISSTDAVSQSQRLDEAHTKTHSTPLYSAVHLLVSILDDQKKWFMLLYSIFFSAVPKEAWGAAPPVKNATAGWLQFSFGPMKLWFTSGNL